MKELFKDRLLKEVEEELLELLNELNIFLQSDKVYEIDPIQHKLLIIQADIMKSYADILELRIKML